MTRVTVEFDEKNLWIAQEVWSDLTAGTSAVAFSSVRSTAVETLKRDGAFIIYSEAGIMRRIDRLSELETFMSETGARRKELGLDTLEP